MTARDEKLKDSINKDVSRTLQEYDLFRNREVRQHMQQMLFIWAKENPEFSY
jgi:TBC1 domain family protein 5